MEETKKTKETIKSILENTSFAEMTEERKVEFLEIAKNEIYEKHKVVLPKGVETHTIVLENGLGCIIKKPNANLLGKVINKISAFVGSPDIVGAGKLILDNCWMCGDKEIQENEEFALYAAMQCVTVVNVMQGSIKKN